MAKPKPKRRTVTRRERLDALAREDARALDDLIARWRALPPERRTNFLRKRRVFAPGSYL
jgi:hypothetical protein